MSRTSCSTVIDTWLANPIDLNPSVTILFVER